MTKTTKRFICLLILIVLTISGNVYADSTEIQIGTDVYNLVTTFCGDAGTMRGFAWSAETSYSNMAIRYAPKDNRNNFITEPAEYTEFNGRLYYKAELDGLEPGKTYEYKIGDTQKNVWSKVYEFTTEADNLTEFSFIGVTDPQSSTAADFVYYTQTLNKAFEDKTDAAFMVNLGDMVNTGSDQNQWDLYFSAAEGMIESLPHMAVVGNHETRGTGGSSNTVDDRVAGKHFSLQFNNPDNGSGALGDLTAEDVSHNCTKGVIDNIKETVYSFDYGNVHFVVLNSGTDWRESDKKKIMTEQAKWLREDLNASDKKWKIVMVHMGLYPAKVERYTTRPELLAVMDECGVDLVLSGHDHMVARTYPMYQDEIMSALNTASVIKNGTVYNIIGSAGSKRYDKITEKPSYLQVLEETSGEQPTYSTFDVNDKRIKVVSKQLDGTVLDMYTIEKHNLGQVEVNAGTDEVAVQGILQPKTTITVLVSYPEVQKVQSEDDICYIDQMETDNKGAYYFVFSDRQKTYGEYKISMNISGIGSQYGFGYQPKIYMLEGQNEIEKLSDISGNSLTAKAEIINIENGRLYCAQYYEGKLVDVKFVDIAKGAGDSMTISYLGSSQVDEIKLFFWDYTSTIPTVEPVIIY